MGENNSKIEKLNFWRLIEKVSIEIPIIQRSYAQGRESQRKIRDNFLGALYDALTKESVELDFVYGSEKGDTYQPLDGQQRLTTLFLLHWYIAVKENKADDFKKRLEKHDEKTIRRKFSYQTRVSSLEFCNELIANRMALNELLPSDKDPEGISKNNELSKTIMNSKWFIPSWKKDPTISAMLIMLDAIHLKFNVPEEFWERLIDEKNPSITFLNIILEKYGLSDDLYIKMNARGKSITEFEDFKSQFEKYIEKNKFEEEIADKEERFAQKIDTVWTDLFWQYREKQEEQENDTSDTEKEEQKENSFIIDNKFINFIAGAAINYYAEKQEIAENVRKELTEKNENKNIKDDAAKKERIERRIQRLANNSAEIIPEDFPAKEAFQYLKDCFNKYSEKTEEYIYAELKPDLPLWNYLNDSLFKDFIKYSKPEYKPRILFYAQTVYLFETNNINEYFSDWMRVVRNIVENTIIEQPSAFISVVKLVNELSKGCKDIYAYLAANEVSSGYAKEQVKEEVEKAKIITANPLKNKQIIHKTEDTNFCKGKINFALYCADYDIDKNPDVTSFDPVKLEKINKVLNEHLSKDNVTNDFRRAFFTIKNNDFYTYWGSFLWAVMAPKRTIITGISDLKVYFTNKEKNYTAYFKELILRLSEKDINTIISEYISTPDFAKLPEWKKIIIREEGILDKSKKHYIAIKYDDSCCWLIPGTRVANDDSGIHQLIKIPKDNEKGA